MLAYNLAFQKDNGYNLIAKREIIKQPTSLDEFIQQAEKTQRKTGRQMTLDEFIQRYKNRGKQQEKSTKGVKPPKTLIIEQQPIEKDKENKQITAQVSTKNKSSWWLWGLLGLGVIYLWKKGA